MDITGRTLVGYPSHSHINHRFLTSRTICIGSTIPKIDVGLSVALIRNAIVAHFWHTDGNRLFFSDLHHQINAIEFLRSDDDFALTCRHQECETSELCGILVGTREQTFLHQTIDSRCSHHGIQDNTIQIRVKAITLGRVLILQRKEDIVDDYIRQIHLSTIVIDEVFCFHLVILIFLNRIEQIIIVLDRQVIIGTGVVIVAGGVKGCRDSSCTTSNNSHFTSTGIYFRHILIRRGIDEFEILRISSYLGRSETLTYFGRHRCRSKSNLRLEFVHSQCIADGIGAISIVTSKGCRNHGLTCTNNRYNT